MKTLCKETSEKSSKTDIETSDDNDFHNNIYCILCNNLITNKNNQISINDAHKHSFANPHGIVFEIGCFSSARGCFSIDKSSSEFTWFSGYSWRITVCNNCQNHNGWLFSSNSNAFFGLILDKLYYN
jgi:hypothetical protein